MSTDSPLACPRCRGPMDLGFLLDRGHHSSANVAQWVEGIPERSVWTGLKTKDREVYPLTSYRCERCGYLELYALPETPPAE